MLVFAISVEHPLDVAVQSSHDADARHHGRAVELDYHEQGFNRGLPLVEQLLGLGELLDVFRGVLQGNDLATVGQRDPVVETALPPARHQANRSAPACVNFTKVRIRV